MAERERFELSIQVLPVYSLSRRAPSADSDTSPCRLMLQLAYLAHLYGLCQLFFKEIQERKAGAGGAMVVLSRRFVCTVVKDVYIF